MIDAVLMFAFITAVGELIIIGSMSRNTRLKFLGSKAKRVTFHILFAALNLWIHWGTITGSMTAVTAFVVSVGVTRLARLYWGSITNGRYTKGLVS
jgi:hypothetical protein